VNIEKTSETPIVYNKFDDANTESVAPRKHLGNADCVDRIFKTPWKCAIAVPTVATTV
jgi:hypothetical protein